MRRTLAGKLTDQALQGMKFPARVAFRRLLLEDLIAEQPRQVEPYRQLIQATRNDDIDHFAQLEDRFQKQADQTPADPLALYLAGLAHEGRNTHLTISLMERAQKLAEGKAFPWPALQLAHVYAPGTKRADAQRALTELSAFFTACPDSNDPVAQSLLTRVGTQPLQSRVALAMRVRLASETDPQRLLAYSTLWGLEFRSHSPPAYNELRQQLASDIARLELLNPSPDAQWLAFLKNGTKQSGATMNAVEAAEERVLKTFPHSDEAYQIVSARWEEAHPAPKDAKDTAKWAAYHALRRGAVETWITQFTGSSQLQHEELFYASEFDPDIRSDEGIRAVNDYLSYISEYDRPSVDGYFWPAFVMVDHNWQPRRVFSLLLDSSKWLDQWHMRMMGDNLTPEAEELWASNETIQRQSVAGVLLVAARLTEQPAEAEKLKPFVERPLPARAWPAIKERYWLNRGRLAAIENRKADALTYYQRALQARVRSPEAVEGRVIDDLSTEAHALWQQLGGTQDGWDLWSEPPAVKVMERNELGWTRPTKPMPPFELADLSGKVWRLKELSGRVLLVNVWATWCPPCQRELPHIQKLYEAVKDRPDIQILTISIDDNPSAIAPFLKQRGYTFPVAPGSTFVDQMLDVVAIPQNWIVDGKGTWRWTGTPNATDAEWEAAMLKQLESVK